MNGKPQPSIRMYYCENAIQGIRLPSGLARLALRDDVVLEPMPCTGRIDSRYLLKAFEGGVSAVCVVSCPNGHCKSMEGNLRAARRIHAVRELLSEAGIDPASVQIFVPSGNDEGAINAAIESATHFAFEDRRIAHRVVA